MNASPRPAFRVVLVSVRASVPASCLTLMPLAFEFTYSFLAFVICNSID